MSRTLVGSLMSTSTLDDVTVEPVDVQEPQSSGQSGGTSRRVRISKVAAASPHRQHPQPRLMC